MTPTDKEFRDWLENPVTQAVRRYLHDYRLRIGQQMAEEWAAGAVITAEAQLDARARVQCLADLADLSFEDMRRFYDDEDTKA